MMILRELFNRYVCQYKSSAEDRWSPREGRQYAYPYRHHVQMIVQQAHVCGRHVRPSRLMRDLGMYWPYQVGFSTCVFAVLQLSRQYLSHSRNTTANVKANTPYPDHPLIL